MPTNNSIICFGCVRRRRRICDCVSPRGGFWGHGASGATHLLWGPNLGRQPFNFHLLPVVLSRLWNQVQSSIEQQRNARETEKQEQQSWTASAPGISAGTLEIHHPEPTIISRMIRRNSWHTKSHLEHRLINTKGQLFTIYTKSSNLLSPPPITFLTLLLCFF